GIRGLQRNGNDWQRVAQADGPEAVARPILIAADHDIIVAGWRLRWAGTLATAPKINFHKIARRQQQRTAFADVIIAVRTGFLVRRAEQLNRRHHTTTAAVEDFQGGITLDVNGRKYNLYGRACDSACWCGNLRCTGTYRDANVSPAAKSPFVHRQLMHVQP